MTEHEQRHAAYLEQVRAKYDADQLKALKAKGHTFPGGTSYPVDDLDDLAKAVKAVGRGGADHDAIRKYVIGRAKALGASDQIPDSWNADGSLKSANSADPAAPVKCATCDGSGKIMDGNRKCPDCNGPGEQRSRPTSEDYTVSEGLKNAKQALAGVKADQLADPDNKTDPDDGAVMAAIEKAEAALDEAIVAQGKDGKYEPEPARSANPATAKRAFSSLIERPPAHKGEFQVRMDDGENENATTARFVGYASTTGVPYSVRDWLGEYQETILPGAFAKTLREQSNVPLLFNHDGIPLASTASGTSRLSEDKTGLRNEADLDRRDAVTNSVCVQLSRGVLDKMSFSFAAVKDSWNEAYDDRGVSEARLYDASPPPWGRVHR
ncbi:MAG: HK97 family phage prohead protease, partial [Solirubrobacteraceae bacterium]